MIAHQIQRCCQHYREMRSVQLGSMVYRCVKVRVWSPSCICGDLSLSLFYCCVRCRHLRPLFSLSFCAHGCTTLSHIPRMCNRFAALHDARVYDRLVHLSERSCDVFPSSFPFVHVAIRFLRPLMRAMLSLTSSSFSVSFPLPLSVYLVLAVYFSVRCGLFSVVNGTENKKNTDCK